MNWALSDWQIELLERGGLKVSSTPVEAPSAELEKVHRALLHGAFTTAEVARILQVGESAVQQRRRDCTLWAVQNGSEWRFPVLQFISDGSVGGQIRGLDLVFSALPKSLSPLAVAGFLTTPQLGLQKKTRLLSPLEWLCDGGDARLVVNVAEAVGWMGI
ncbi:Uncharacterised protein [Mycobacteroides abscessus subsp. massiliense]|nr:Uncharacterised protein [Mycobacteroides abscessus subsp. abscessus]SKJ21908.1 Uncharacterised protein [Mycobacteroides abscessus subsp. massiliense]SKJ82027.1 Uncharacterised protein [Mycobacteroides abscessus subsp. massiliense]SKK40893.1 Uncharacterised protein [Mycobacteroides abscessus subsp. massiliense]SKR64554.1 Uncharacterised protein [Mycobacteroides abscessus subsp. massiliense]